MNPGRFDTPCKFWEASFEADEYGGMIESWSVVSGSPSWCKVEPLRGGERFAAMMVQAVVENKVIIRRWPDLLHVHEIEIRGQRFNIQSIEDHGRDGVMVLWVQRKS